MNNYSIFMSNAIYEDMSKHKDLSNSELYNLLLKKYSETKVNYVMLDEFKYVHNSTEEKVKRKDQKTFRQDLIERYKTCIITECDEMVCEACHIVPFEECDETEKYNVNNGLLLRSDFHILFDKKLLKINSDTLKIELSGELVDDPNMKEYKKYDGKILNIHKNSIKYLKRNY